MIVFVPRGKISLLRVLATPAIAVLITLVIGALIFRILGYSPLVALYHFFIAPVSQAYQIADLLVKACPLVIIACGLVYCYRANVWNIGAEGQMILGAMFAGYVALFHPQLGPWAMMPLMILAGMLGGIVWAMIPALFRTRFNTNEILVSLMLTYVAVLLLDWVVRGPWRDPLSFGFPLTKLYVDAALIQRIDIPGIGALGQLHWGVVGACLVAAIAWFVLYRSLPGFQVRVAGEAPRAAGFAGFGKNTIIIAVFGASGAAAGLAGMVEVSANIGQLQPDISFGYGFTAIIVAFLARLNPIGVIVAGLVVALADLGGDSVQIALGMPKVVSDFFKGVLFFMLLAGETLNRYRIEVRARGAIDALVGAMARRVGMAGKSGRPGEGQR